eukprot:Skav213042  [mRNA]  locus=scaffold844:715291:720234:- [translate_table: standard]
MLIVLKAPHLHLRFLVVHGPYDGATDASFEEWWSEMSQAVNNTCPDLPLIVLGDCNARIGTNPSEAISTHGSEAENAVGVCLHSFLLEHSLWVPATFSRCHEGQTHTWISSTGVKHRLDYICLPQSWKSFVVTSQVSHDIDLATARQDHFVVTVNVQMEFARSSREHMPQVRLDARKCQDLACRKQFLEYLHKPPVFPWSLGTSEHAEQLTEWVQVGAQKIFSRDRQLPKQRYMSQDTWQVVQLRKQLLKIQLLSERHSRQICLHVTLQAWFACRHPHRSPWRQPMWIAVAKRTQQMCDHTFWWALHNRKSLHALSRHMSKQDRVASMQAILQSFYAASQSHDSRRLYQALRPLLGQQGRQQKNHFRPIPAVRDEQGQLQPDSTTAAECWRRYFAAPEQGIASTIDDIQRLAKDDFPVYPQGSIEFDPFAIPSLESIEQFILRSRCHKSPGLDGLPAEVYKLHPAVFARLLWPLFLKFSVRLDEPVRWKGGEICTLPKTSHAGLCLDQFRSILLADFSSKISHGILRQRLLPRYDQYRLNMQGGGIPQFGTDMLLLFVQSFAQLCRQKHTSCVALFVDIKQAFYRTCRPMLVKGPCDHLSIAQFFHTVGWSPDFFHSFQAHLQEQDALTQAQVSAHQKAQVRTVLHATWFQMRSNPQTLTATKAGTKPGDAIADLLYGFVMSRFLHDLRAQFKHANLHTSFELHWLPIGPLDDGEFPAQDIIQGCWVDDLVLLLQDKKPQVVLDKLRTAIELTYDLALEYMLQLNMGPNKTAAVAMLRGPGSQELWARLLHQNPDSPRLDFHSRHSQQMLSLDIVPDYVYLGSLQDQSGHQAVEVKRRLLSAKVPQRLLRLNVFKSPKVPYTTKRQLFRSLTLSKVLYGAGAWQRMHIQTLQSWNTQLIKLYHQMIPHFHRGADVYNLDIVARCQLPHPLLLLAQQRFSLFDRIMQTELTELLAVLQHQQANTGWFAQICMDLTQISSFLATSEPLDWVDMADISQVAVYSFQRPQALTKLGRQVTKLYLGYLRIWRDFRAFQQHFSNDMEVFGVQWYQDPIADAQVGSFECHLCSATFVSYKALCTHIFKEHGMANVAHKYADLPTCRACLKCYNDRDRLVHHLKYFRTGCLLKLVLSVDPLTEEELATIQEHQQQLRRTSNKQPRKQRHAWPVVQAAGPLRPWPWQRGLQHTCHDQRPMEQVPTDAMDSWISDVLCATYALDFEMVYQVLSTHHYGGHLAHALLERFAHNSTLFSHADATDQFLLLQEAMDLWQDDALVPSRRLSQVPLDVVRMTLRNIRVPNVSQHPSILPVEDRRTQLVEQIWHDYDVVLQIRLQLSKVRARVPVFPQVIPRPMIEHPVYLYMFSGRRRPQDYQFHLEELLQSHGCQGLILCLDLAISDSHDVTNEKLVTDLIHGLTTGHIAAYLVAPPCETWSEIRYHQLQDQSCPRPVRTTCDPFGIQGLTWKEVQQVATANFLLFVAVRLLSISALSGVPAIMEHPKPSRHGERASIWRLPWLQQLCEAHMLQLHVVLQARYGATSLKPTYFATCHVDCFSTVAARYAREVQWDQLEKLEGKRTDGSWKTAAAKEYPGDLNRVLAHSHVLSVLQRQRVTKAVGAPNPGLVSTLQALYAGDVDIMAQRMQPDYGVRLTQMD